MGTILIKPLEVSIRTFFTFFFFFFRFFFLGNLCILSSMKTAICLAVCCFLLIFRFELGNATKTQYAKLKRANFYEKADEHVGERDEHVGRNKRCVNWLGRCKRSWQCCGSNYCSNHTRKCV